MPGTGWNRSIAPKGDDHNVYLVVDDLGRNGRVYREADAGTADLESVILDLARGPVHKPGSGRRRQHCRKMVTRCLG
jgi:hypothetical protein